MRRCILYFLGYFYYKNGDISAAIENLKKCADLRTNEEKFKDLLGIRQKSLTEEAAFELPNSIWDHEIRPTWWRWWLHSPLYFNLKRIIFGILLLSIFSLLGFHPFISGLLYGEINWTVYIILISFLIFLLLSPGIQRIKVEGFEVELQSPLPPIPFLSPPKTEGIEELRESYEKG